MTLSIMLPVSKYIGNQNLTLIIFISSLISLTAIATSLHLGLYKYFLKKINYNKTHQHNIMFVGSIIFFELRGIKYTIRKSESKTSFAYHANWNRSNPELEQLRAIFCSLCIHNFRGITPSKITRWEIQHDWETYVDSNLSTDDKKILWKKQAKMLQAEFKNNKKLVQKLHKMIQTNIECEEISQYLKAEIQPNKVTTNIAGKGKT
jgi:hypothetical protein